MRVLFLGSLILLTMLKAHGSNFYVIPVLHCDRETYLDVKVLSDLFYKGLTETQIKAIACNEVRETNKTVRGEM